MRQELAPLLAPGARSGVFLDFDGTLSDIVPVASDARPVRGARELLCGLAEIVDVVAIVSGRSARQLLEWLGPIVEIWGLHGAERAVGGDVELAPHMRPYLGVMKRVLTQARKAVASHADEGIAVEDKTAVITLHYRSASDREGARAAVERIAQDLAARHGLVTVPGRAAVELRPPVELSKAAVVRARAREAKLSAAMFVGDDSVDVPAFQALEELARDGLDAVKVAVASDEAPPELLRRADVVVEGTHGVITLLTELLEGAG